MYVSHNAPCSPSSPTPHKNTNLDNLCLSFLLSITAVPRQTQDNDCAKCGGRGGKQGVLWEMCIWRIDLKMIFILIQLKLIFTRIVLYTLKARVFGTQKWHITLNPKPPLWAHFFQPLLRGVRGLI